jgi:hypothetical protein
MHINVLNVFQLQASWLYQSSQLMTSLKRAQLRQQAKHRLTTNRDTSNTTNSISDSGEKKND